MAYRGVRVSQCAEFIADFHRNGLNDIEIGERLGMHQATIRRFRRQAGLPCKRSRIAARRVRQQCRVEGVRSLAELRALKYRQAVYTSGWPSDLTRREVEVLNALYQCGPLTALQIVKVLGGTANQRPATGWLRLLEAPRRPGGTIMAYLRRRGLVERVLKVEQRQAVSAKQAAFCRGCVAQGMGKECQRDRTAVYRLADGAKRRVAGQEVLVSILTEGKAMQFAPQGAA